MPRSEPIPAIGISTLYLSYPEEPYELLCNALSQPLPPAVRPAYWELVDEGFHTITARRVRRLRELGAGKLWYTMHCPYSAARDLGQHDPERRRKALRRLRASLDVAAALHVKAWTLHPGDYPSNRGDRSAWERNREAVLTLIDYGEAHDVPVALENMVPNGPGILRTPGDFARFMAEAGGQVRLTLDVGHAHVGRFILRFLTRFHRRILVLHAHDNDGTADLHRPVGTGTIDWVQLCQALRHYRYGGLITVEAMSGPYVSLARFRELFQLQSTRASAPAR